jgi:HEPN domain-containing protein
MPHDAGSPAAWLRFARADMGLARQRGAPDALLEALCFHAQQCAEKSLKAVLVHHGITVPRTHSIERLIDLLPVSVERGSELGDAATLSDYAVGARYPVDQEPVTEDEYEEAVRLAAAVLRWATDVVEGRSPRAACRDASG